MDSVGQAIAHSQTNEVNANNNTIHSGTGLDLPEEEKLKGGTVSFDWPLPLEKLYHWEKFAPNRTCFFQPLSKRKVQSLTWSEVAEQARKVAAYLVSLDLAQGSHIGIMSANSAYWIIADLAIWMAGHVSVPIFPSINSAYLNKLIQHSDCKLMFVGKSDHYSSSMAALPEDLRLIYMPLSSTPKEAIGNKTVKWSQILDNFTPFQASPARHREEVATIIYTSGTLGEPKGVMHSFGAMAGTITRAQALFSVRRHDRLISFMPLAHVTERLCVEMASLYSGLAVYFVHSTRSLVSELRGFQPTIFFGVPQVWRRLQQEVFNYFPSPLLNLMLRIPLVSAFVKLKIKRLLGFGETRLFCSGAAHISSALIDWFKALDIEILEFYGMTENFAYSHTARVGRSFAGYVGYANPGVVAQFSEDGEVLVSSPGNMMGYYKAPTLTTKVMTSEGFIRTGDLGVLDRKGRLKITGRRKESFKTARGQYVFPAVIESLFLESPIIEHACVLGEAMKQPVVLLSLVDSVLVYNSWMEKKSQVEAYLIAFRDRVNEALSDHERIEQVVIISEPWSIEAGMLTPTYKIKRKYIEQRFKRKLVDWLASSDPVIWYFTS